MDAEVRDAFVGALSCSRVAWLTTPQALARAELKIVQLQTATKLKIRIPITCVTNSSQRAIEFAAQVGNVVAKPIRYGLVAVTNPPSVAWTTAVTRDDLQQLSGVPTILQETIPARAHLRVTTVGPSVFVARLEAPELDWRSEPTNHERWVPELRNYSAVRVQALSIASALHLGFSTQDWIVDSDERAYFLEANPNGQWLFLDVAFSGSITLALAQMLELLALRRYCDGS